MSTYTYKDGRLTEAWDDTARTYTAWDAQGTQTASRAYTTEENARADAEAAQTASEANRTTLQAQAETALAGNRTFLALSSPTNAQTLAQVKALTRQNNGIIRLLLNKLDGTD